MAASYLPQSILPIIAKISSPIIEDLKLGTTVQIEKC